MTKKRVLSGIRATGRLHLGNYLGAVKGMLELQNDSEYETLYMVADLHTITTPFDVEELRKNRKEVDVAESHHRYLPNISESPAVTNIYGDKIAIIIWTDEPEGIIIENAAAAKAYKSYFDFMWEKSKKFK